MMTVKEPHRIEWGHRRQKTELMRKVRVIEEGLVGGEIERQILNDGETQPVKWE